MMINNLLYAATAVALLFTFATTEPFKAQDINAAAEMQTIIDTITPNDNWRSYCTDPVKYRKGGRKHILYLVWRDAGEDAALEANARLAEPVEAGTLTGWFWQWPKWAALGAR